MCQILLYVAVEMVKIQSVMTKYLLVVQNVQNYGWIFTFKT